MRVWYRIPADVAAALPSDDRDRSAVINEIALTAPVADINRTIATAPRMGRGAKQIAITPLDSVTKRAAENTWAIGRLLQAAALIYAEQHNGAIAPPS